uniref:DAGKa domain-containing protein n=1 Tax=Heterorhabditis bacteriophora TaxID=37862 RepID=A0A1I7X5A6_HETBA
MCYKIVYYLCMGWGGVFSDEPMSQLLQAILHETTVTHLDRWRIEVEPNAACPLDASDELSDAVQSSLPLTVMNNYFSIGADAHVALQFHHSRSTFCFCRRCILVFVYWYIYIYFKYLKNMIEFMNQFMSYLDQTCTNVWYF